MTKQQRIHLPVGEELITYSLLRTPTGKTEMSFKIHEQLQQWVKRLADECFERQSIPHAVRNFNVDIPYTAGLTIHADDPVRAEDRAAGGESQKRWDIYGIHLSPSVASNIKPNLRFESSESIWRNLAFIRLCVHSTERKITFGTPPEAWALEAHDVKPYIQFALDRAISQLTYKFVESPYVEAVTSTHTVGNNS
jgi:hypothetical protein